MSAINKNNNFGFLRLLLAALVIFSHSPELIDGNRSREILTHIFGTISLGELAVDGFFLISGYLILKSFYASNSLKSYILKRCIRIYPAFIVAYLICVLIVAPLALGIDVLGKITLLEWLKSIAKMLLLGMPHVEGVFAGNHYQNINGSMWTIRYEFLCYVMIPVFAYLGIYKKPYYLITVLLLMCVLLYNTLTNTSFTLPLAFEFSRIVRLLLVFLIGGCFHVFKDEIRWDKRYAAISFIALMICLNIKPIAELGLLIFGAYLLFYFALHYQNKMLNSIGVKTDISYGVYLYAWPIQSLFVQYVPTIAPYQLNIMTLVLTALLAYMSWYLIEKPCMRFKGKLL